MRLNDPRVRRDGTCAVCGKERKAPAHVKPELRAEILADPFCSSTCAKRYHNVTDVTPAAPRAALRVVGETKLARLRRLVADVRREEMKKYEARLRVGD